MVRQACNLHAQETSLRRPAWATNPDLVSKVNKHNIININTNTPSHARNNPSQPKETEQPLKGIQLLPGRDVSTQLGIQEHCFLATPSFARF